MTTDIYKPFVKERLADIPEVGSAAYDNNPRPFIHLNGSGGKLRVLFGEMVGDVPKERVQIGEINLAEIGLAPEEILRQEAAAYGSHAQNITLVYMGTVIQAGEPLGKKHDRTPYKIQLEKPAFFEFQGGITSMSGMGGELTLYGFDFNNANGFNAGEESKLVDAGSLGWQLNGRRAVVQEPIPFFGNKDYFIQGHFRYVSPVCEVSVGIHGENLAWGMRRKQDETLEVIVVAEPFKQIITSDIIQGAIREIRTRK